MSAPPPTGGALAVHRAIPVCASPSRVMAAFFDADDLAAWWGVTRSVTLLRPLGPFAVEWTPTEFTDDVPGPLGG